MAKLIDPLKLVIVSCNHINGSLPDHDERDCPRDETCSVYTTFMVHPKLSHLVNKKSDTSTS